MTMLTEISPTRVPKRRMAVTDETIEASVESVLASELAAERLALDAPEDIDDLLVPFQNWADAYGLAPTSYVCAAYLLELRHYDEDIDSPQRHRARIYLLA